MGKIIHFEGGNYTGQLIECPWCRKELWCIRFDMNDFVAEMMCWKCKQTWFDVPFFWIREWFVRRMRRVYGKNLHLDDYVFLCKKYPSTVRYYEVEYDTKGKLAQDRGLAK